MICGRSAGPGGVSGGVLGWPVRGLAQTFETRLVTPSSHEITKFCPTKGENMGRPTEERKDRAIKLRISEDLYSVLRTRGGNLSETIREILKNAGSENEKANSSVPQNNYSASIKELEGMASCSGLSVEELITGMLDLLESGDILIQNGKLGVCTSDWAGEFENTCHDLCIPVEKAAESAIKALKRGGV